jgi:AcrR family transcriptional regulator
MARPKQFDIDAAVAAAVSVFRDHGYEGTSAQMLVDAMGIGRQSLYDTFGDKWGIYCAALRQYCQQEVSAHVTALADAPRAINGIRAMLERVVADAAAGCMGIGSVVEFGCTRPELVRIRDSFGAVLAQSMTDALHRARQQGDLGADIAIDPLTAFLLQTISSIRLAARAGASADHVAAMVPFAMRALR